MSVTTSESLSPLGESQAASRKKRLVHLARMIHDLIGERVRYQGGINHGFDDIEAADLIDALRACSHYVNNIGWPDTRDPLIIQIEGIDGHRYLIFFSLFGPGFTIRAARVRITTLPLVGDSEVRVESTNEIMDILEDHSQKVKLNNISTDRSFLMGMSMVIGFMDQADEDPDEDTRLAPLLAQVMPTSDELREIRSNLPPSLINYDDEGDLPY